EPQGLGGNAGDLGHFADQHRDLPRHLTFQRTGRSTVTGPPLRRPVMDVTLLYFDGCPSWETTDQRLRELADELGFHLAHRKVESPEAAEELSFRGSPTVLIDGRDPFARGDEPVGLSCRIYQT